MNFPESPFGSRPYPTILEWPFPNKGSFPAFLFLCRVFCLFVKTSTKCLISYSALFPKAFRLLHNNMPAFVLWCILWGTMWGGSQHIGAFHRDGWNNNIMTLWHATVSLYPLQKRNRYITPTTGEHPDSRSRLTLSPAKTKLFEKRRSSISRSPIQECLV